MAKKKNQRPKQTGYHPPKAPRNEFMRNHPLAYLAVAIIAFVLGNYIFDWIAQIF